MLSCQAVTFKWERLAILDAFKGDQHNNAEAWKMYRPKSKFLARLNSTALLYKDILTTF